MSSAKTGQRVTMVGRPLVDQLAITRRPRQEYPSRAAAERFSHGDEFGAPTLKGPKIADDGLAQRASRIALIAQPVKEQLVQDHRIHRNQLFALKSVDQETGCFIEFELRDLFVNKVEALNCAAIIVLVMADDEPLRHAFDPSRVAGQWFHRVRHGQLLNPLNSATAREQRASMHNSSGRASARTEIAECWAFYSVQAQPPRQSECCAGLGRKSSDGEPASPQPQV